MKVFHEFAQLGEIPQLAVITIGNFDGVHLGHQTILNHTKDYAKNYQCLAAVITFSNHPSEVLRPNHPAKLITTPEHKLQLLQEQGIDLTLMLPFTKELSVLSCEEFLTKLMDTLSFKHLVLGYDAKIGKDRQGDGPILRELAKKMHFSIETLPPFALDNEPVSSTRLRHAIISDDLKLAGKLQGRPYSIYSMVTPGAGKGKTLGFPTANLDVQAFCLPPFGVYAVKVKHNGKLLNGVANLGFAPTVRQDRKALLEVHLFDQNQTIYGDHVEVIFVEFLRPERLFENLEALKEQIAKDIAEAKSHLKIS